MNKRESANLRKFQLLASDVVSVFDLLLRYQSPMISLSVKSKGKTKNNIKTFSSISISFSDLLTLQIAILLLIFGSYLHTLFSILVKLVSFCFSLSIFPVFCFPLLMLKSDSEGMCIGIHEHGKCGTLNVGSDRIFVPLFPLYAYVLCLFYQLLSFLLQCLGLFHGTHVYTVTHVLEFFNLE